MGCLSGPQASGKPLSWPTVGIVRILGLESHLLTECISTGILRHVASENSKSTGSLRTLQNNEVCNRGKTNNAVPPSNKPGDALLGNKHGVHLTLLITSAHAVEYLPGIEWNEPELVTPGATNRDHRATRLFFLMAVTSMPGIMLKHGQ